jgi:hypothetical protein
MIPPLFRFLPVVEPLAPQARVTIASANRLSIFSAEQTPSWCILHEIAHAMTSTADGNFDGNGANFIRIYLRLIVRYLRRSPDELQQTIQDNGLNFRSTRNPHSSTFEPGVGKSFLPT